MARKLTKKVAKIQKVVKKAQSSAPASGRNKTKSEKPEIALPTSTYFEGIGRRKVATARVRVYKTGGDFIVNGQAAGQYFDNVVNASVKYTKPLSLVNLLGKVTVSAKVSGSGKSGQLDAVIHGLSRALVAMNIDFKPVLKENGLMTRDDRMKETRKVGMGGSARRKRQSPKR